MKFAKLLSSLLFIAALFFTALPSSAAVKNHSNKLPVQVPGFSPNANSLYEEYKEIDGVMWVFIYGDDGRLIDSHPIFD